MLALAAGGEPAQLANPVLGRLHIRDRAGRCTRIGVAAPQVARWASLDHRSDSHVGVGGEEEIDNPGVGAAPLRQHLVHPNSGRPQGAFLTLLAYSNYKENNPAPAITDAVDKFLCIARFEFESGAMLCALQQALRACFRARCSSALAGASSVLLLAALHAGALLVGEAAAESFPCGLCRRRIAPGPA
jgi:hypothetical protein